MSQGNKEMMYCSFCGKASSEVFMLIAGPKVFICDECVENCNELIKEKIKKFKELKEDIDKLRNIFLEDENKDTEKQQLINAVKDVITPAR